MTEGRIQRAIPVVFDLPALSSLPPVLEQRILSLGLNGAPGIGDRLAARMAFQQANRAHGPRGGRLLSSGCPAQEATHLLDCRTQISAQIGAHQTDSGLVAE